MILALSTLDNWLLGAVALLTLVAIGHLAAKWQQHTAAPRVPPATKGPKKRRPPSPSSIPSPPQPPPPRHTHVEPKLTAPWSDGPEATLEHRRAWVRERVVHWWVVANRVHGANLDDVPTVTFSPRLKHALGWAASQRNLLKFSDHHLMDKSRQVADETVAHEVAHIFADRHYGQQCRHGKLWKRTMVAMGQKPDVTFKDTPEDGPEEETLETTSPSLPPTPSASRGGRPVPVG